LAKPGSECRYRPHSGHNERPLSGAAPMTLSTLRWPTASDEFTLLAVAVGWRLNARAQRSAIKTFVRLTLPRVITTASATRRSTCCARLTMSRPRQQTSSVFSTAVEFAV
jgi:hypothetical protein